MAEEIRFPRLGWSMEEGQFVAWLKKNGEAVVAGEPLFEMEGEKALQQIEALESGTLLISADGPKPGSVVTVGTLLGYLLAAGESSPGTANHAKGPSSVEPVREEQPQTANNTNAPAAPSVRRLARELSVEISKVSGTGKAGRVTSEDVAKHAQSTFQKELLLANTGERIATPRAKRVARELGVDWREVQGTGRDGRVRERDIKTAHSNRGPAGTRSHSTAKWFTPRRKAIAERLRASLQSTVPVTITTTADVSALVALREQFKSAEAKTVPSYSDMMARIVGLTLSDHPQMAMRWNADGTDLMAMDQDPIDIGLAVDTPSGLLVPILRDVRRQSLVDVARQSNGLIQTARAGRLGVAEMQGGAISISNLGGYGIDGFTPIINYPQIAILGMGAIRREPVFGRNDEVIAKHRMVLSLTFDHAAVDGAPAAAFLQSIVRAMLDCGSFL